MIIHFLYYSKIKIINKLSYNNYFLIWKKMINMKLENKEKKMI